MAYSKDFKAAALAAVDAGKHTKTKIAELFGITREGLRKWRRERDAERAGTRPPKRKTGPKPIGLYTSYEGCRGAARSGKCRASKALPPAGPARTSTISRACSVKAPANRPVVVTRRCRLVERPDNAIR